MNNRRMRCATEFTPEGLKLHILLYFFDGHPFKYEAATNIALNVDGSF